MARDPQLSDDIDGYRFEVTPLGFSEGSKLFTLLAKKLGPALGHLAAPGKNPDLAAALTSALKDIDHKDLMETADTLGKTTRFLRDGGSEMPYLNKDNREVLFAGRLVLFFKWIEFALEVNFADFFDAFKGLRAPVLGGSTPGVSSVSPKS